MLNNVVYLLLVKHHFNTISFSYRIDSVYDLSLLFYSSDIDKSASAAF